MKLFRLNFATLLIRYYLMMVAVILAGFSGNWWLALIALPIFMSCLTGVTFTIGRKSQPETVRRTNEASTRALEEKEEEEEVQAAA